MYLLYDGDGKEVNIYRSILSITYGAGNDTFFIFSHC